MSLGHEGWDCSAHYPGVVWFTLSRGCLGRTVGLVWVRDPGPSEVTGWLGCLDCAKHRLGLCFPGGGRGHTLSISPSYPESISAAPSTIWWGSVVDSFIC